MLMIYGILLEYLHIVYIEFGHLFYGYWIIFSLVNKINRSRLSRMLNIDIMDIILKTNRVKLNGWDQF